MIRFLYIYKAYRKRRSQSRSYTSFSYYTTENRNYANSGRNKESQTRSWCSSMSIDSSSAFPYVSVLHPWLLF